MSLQTQLTRLLNNLPDFFYKSGNVYSFFISIANELYLTEELLSDIQNQINVNTATGDSLDLHGESFNLYRNSGEGDLAFRTRILSSFVKKQVTKPRIIDAVEDLSEDMPVIEEYFIDKWFLEGNPNREQVTETVTPSGNTFSVSYEIANDTYPSIFPFYDINKTGTNYGSGSTFSDVTITTALTLPYTGIEYSVIYTPAIVSTTETTATDFYAESFLGDRTILRKSNVHNNVGKRWLTTGTTLTATSSSLYEQDSTSIATIADSIGAGYDIDVEWWDSDNNHVYRWRTETDDREIIRFDETKRIDSLIDGERTTASISGSSTSVLFNIAKVNGVYDDEDLGKTGTNYYIDSVTESVTATNCEYIEVANSIYDITSIYVNDPLSTETNYWTKGVGKGNFFIDNKIYLAYKLPKHQQAIQVIYDKCGGFSDNTTITLSQSASASQGLIVSYNTNPISNYSNITFSDLLFAGHSDTKFTFEVQINQTVIKWGDGTKFGEGVKWGAFNNTSVQTAGEIVDLAKAAGTKSYVILRTPTALYGESIAVYGEIYYGYSYY